MTELYHFTCDHHLAGILNDGQLRPHRHPMLGRSLVWLTDMAEPDAWALGLTSRFLSCDRTAHRFRVTDTSTCRRFSTLKRLPSDVVADLVRFGKPARWWFSTRPVPVVLG